MWLFFLLCLLLFSFGMLLCVFLFLVIIYIYCLFLLCLFFLFLCVLNVLVFLFSYCYCFVGLPLVVPACVCFMCVDNFPGPSSFHVHCYVFSVLKILIPYGSTCFLRSHTPNTSSEGNWIHRSIRIRIVVIRVAKLPLIKLHHIISYHIPCISP